MLISDDQEPVVSLQERIVLRVGKSGLLSILKVHEFDSELACEDVTNDNLLFIFDLGGHLKFDDWECVDAELLLFNCLLELAGALLEAKNVRGHVKSLLFGKSGILVNSLLLHLLIHPLDLFFAKTWKLGVRVLLLQGTGHEVLGELNESQDVFGSDWLLGKTRSESV